MLPSLTVAELHPIHDREITTYMLGRPLKKCGSAACLRAPHRQALGGGTAIRRGGPRLAPQRVRAHGRAPLPSPGTSDFRLLWTSSTACRLKHAQYTGDWDTNRG